MTIPSPIRLAFLAFLLAVAALVAYDIIARELRFDDAYAFIRYAGNVLATGNYGWNPGERTYGCTSIGYTFFIALMRLFGLDALGPGRLLRVASLFWAIAAIVLLARVVRHAARGTMIEGSIARQGLLVATAAAPITFLNALTGMDTTLGLFATTAILFFWFRFSERPTTTRWVLAVTSCYAAYLVRPDNAIYALVFPILFLRQERQPPARVAAIYGLLLALFALDTIVKARYFGNPLPLPFYAKTGAFYEGYVGVWRWNALKSACDFLLTYGGVLGMLGLLHATGRSVRQAAPYLLPLAVTLACLLAVTQIMGQWSRFYLPSMPFLVTGLIVALRNARPQSISATAIAWAFLAVAAFILTRDVVSERLASMRLAREVAVAARFRLDDSLAVSETRDPWWEGIAMMNEIAGRLPPGSTVAASEHGYISAMNPKIRILDLAGIHDNEFALHGWSDDMLRHAAPEVIWMPHSDYVGFAHRLHTGAYFASAYDFFPHALAYGVALRRDSPHYAMVREILEGAEPLP